MSTMNMTSTQAQAEASIVQTLIQTMPQTMGACLVGLYLSAVFYGVTLLQTYQYFNRYYGRDNIYLYAMVTAVTLLDTFAVISNMYSLWFYLIKNFANPIAILTIDWSLTFSIMATAIVAFLVQSFYAYRAYILGRKKILIPTIIITFGLASLVLTIVYMALLFRNGSLLFIPKVTSLSTAALSCAFCADTLISSSITVYLLQGRQKGLKKSDRLIRKLVIYTINTGILTTACTIITLVLGEALSNTFYNTIFYFPLSKCYVNSMLAFLNARESLRNNGGNVVSFNMNASEHSTPKFRAYPSPEATTENPLSNKDVSSDGSTAVFNTDKIGSLRFPQLTEDPIITNETDSST